MSREIKILADGATIAKRAADLLLASAQQAVAQRGLFSIALAGGSTPKTLYGLLVSDPKFRDHLPWDKMQFFFGDERHVGPTDSDSNFKMATDTLFSKSSLKPGQIHRIKGEYPDAEKAALEYEAELRQAFNLTGSALPRFDVVLHGMGNEGHTLSLFPGTKALHPGNRLVMSNWIGKLYTERITFTHPVANNSANIIFMVTGADKAMALKAVLEGPYEPEQLPSQLIQPANGNLFWFVDTAAGGMLTTGDRE